ncbi:DUF1850 domain-containing protein [Alkalihalobacillus sp. MEB130]|uniref:DUF1850 domain-containing protein n=1 Tax=Alkalihalobacillus sp. MEB130 TaxID=2976704 RepID=UPI0028DE6477|nr:DUF1850 domain-containing protein [Alkalihalobacillus sp. MEB130]MDT8858674.1 DUF1850 domain-containing protein [Alkalihalobacillus sp. MEB130]
MMRTKKKHVSKKALLLSTAFLFLFMIAIWTATSVKKQEYFLQIYLPYEDTVFFEAPIEQNDTFYHEYLHSVELSPVREYFKVDEHYKLIATESWTKSFGAGLPYETKDKLENIDGFFVIHEERELEYLNILPSHLYPHSFHFKDQSVDLSGELSGERIRIQIIEH